MQERAHISEDPMGRALLGLHAAVRRTLASLRDGASLSGKENPKGDLAYNFDLAADAAARLHLVESLGPLRILSEEGEPNERVEDTPDWQVVLDPVDGSENRFRGLPLSAVCAALLPSDAPLRPSRVEWAMVGNLEEETPLLAARGRGAWRGRILVQASGISRVEDALLSFDLNQHVPSAFSAALMGRCRGVRSFGCASQAITLVATGALDAHVDVRNQLTPESFFASARILEEAGGCLVGPRGEPLREAKGMTDRLSLVAASSRELASEIIEILSSKGC